ncbi:crossover junction endodeoxyribonuclease RuvC [Candidatus Margulisiibacteriota bacterium]
MIICGIDPGFAITGFGIIEIINGSPHLIDYGTIQTSSKTPFSKRLLLLSEGLSEIITKYSPESIAVEELFFNNNAKTALAVAHARGVILLTAEKLSKNIYSYTPLQIKTAVTGYGLAHKKQVQYMVCRLLNLKKTPKPDDAADALASAICHSQLYKIKSLG